MNSEEESSWSSPEITPITYCLHDKTIPAKMAARDYITQAKATLNPDKIRFTNLNDVQNPEN